MNKDDKQVYVYDTTLRDGCQAEGVSLSLEEKVEVARKLDELGVHYIEGGYPLSNPKDAEFFEKIRDVDFENARITAFGSTRRATTSCEDDRGMKALLEAGTPAVTLVAKAWDRHVEKVLGTSLAENLRMIEDSIRFLKEHDREVILDAEHFFDGFKENRQHAMDVVKTAAGAGADWIVPCDTNGGALTSEISRCMAQVGDAVDVPLGIHCHDDSGLAVANSVASVQAGARHVQGTLNGFGERCGNMDLCVAIPIIELKTSCRAIGRERLKKLTEVSRFAYEEANMMFRASQPFVGSSAFAHKGGLHVDAMLKDELTYEHINPAVVGNERRFLVSELSGKATVREMFKRYNIDEDKQVMSRILNRVAQLENEGYQFEAAEGSFALLARKEAGTYRRFFDVEGYHVSTIKQANARLVTDATVKLSIDGHREHTASEGDGPVNALDGAMRKALEHHYPPLGEMHLTDFMVRVINPKEATAARVRVVIQSADSNGHTWGTVGVSENIIEASWEALVDSIEYKLLMEECETD
ncbi:MAG: citramalate synthase [Planctomycetota bacterium]